MTGAGAPLTSRARTRADRRTLRVALAGNPNVGKSSLFNRLTGADQHVGNWPGKTVERREGTCTHGPAVVSVVDLPGTYSLGAASPEEEVARDVLTSGTVDLVAVVVDASRLERSLYLAVQLVDLNLPTVLVLNMVDAAAADGIVVDDQAIADRLGVPVVRTVARTGAGVDALLDVCVETATGPRELSVADVEPSLEDADRRFTTVHEVMTAAVTTSRSRRRSDRLDDVLTHPVAGLPIFLAMMWLVFSLVTDLAAPFVDAADAFARGPVAGAVRAVLGVLGLGGSWIEAAIGDGAVAGVGAVLAFVPVLAVLYLALGLLEDSGYMARAAFLVDRLLYPIGLTGKSFLPLLVGFGCNVAGVYATRVLERRRDRILTALLLPFASCAARLPIYVLLTAVFFPAARGTVLLVLYLASLLVMGVVGAVLDRVVGGERNRSFVLELPAYRRPDPRVLGRYVWQRVRGFVRRAGTMILAASMVVWFLLAIPVAGRGGFADVALEDSAFAATARILAPVLAPAGLGSWELTGALATGIVAKETVVASLEQVHATDDASLADSLEAGFDRASGGHGRAAAAAFLAFVLLYVPCVATIAAVRHELGGRWALVSVGLNLTVAWVVATGVFQVGRLLGG